MCRVSDVSFFFWFRLFRFDISFFVSRLWCLCFSTFFFRHFETNNSKHRKEKVETSNLQTSPHGYTIIVVTCFSAIVKFKGHAQLLCMSSVYHAYCHNDWRLAETIISHDIEVCFTSVCMFVYLCFVSIVCVCVLLYFKEVTWLGFLTDVRTVRSKTLTLSPFVLIICQKPSLTVTSIAVT